VLEFLKIYGGYEPSRNRVVVPACQAIKPGGIGSLDSILGLLKSLKIRAQGLKVGQVEKIYHSAAKKCKGVLSWNF
jgi:hypothetical protein